MSGLDLKLNSEINSEIGNLNDLLISIFSLKFAMSRCSFCVKHGKLFQAGGIYFSDKCCYSACSYVPVLPLCSLLNPQYSPVLLFEQALVQVSIQINLNLLLLKTQLLLKSVQTFVHVRPLGHPGVLQHPNTTCIYLSKGYRTTYNAKKNNNRPRRKKDKSFQLSPKGHWRVSSYLWIRYTPEIYERLTATLKSSKLVHIL